MEIEGTVYAEKKAAGSAILEACRFLFGMFPQDMNNALRKPANSSRCPS